MTADTDVPIAGYQVEPPALAGRLGPILRAVRSADQTAVVVHVVAGALSGAVSDRVVAEARERVGIVPDHVVPLLDAGLDASGRPFLVTPWVPAGSLAERLGTTGPMPVPAAMRAGVEAAHGLAELHRRGSVHGRVTPANLLVDADGTVAVTGAVLPALAVAGEPGPFDPPEGPGTPAADIYALAAAVVALIVGKPPAPDNVPDHPDLSVAARGVLGCALASDPTARFATATGFAAALTDAGEVEAARSADPLAAVAANTQPAPILTAAQVEPTGRPLGSRYLLDAAIGRGATGQVWRARRRDTGEAVAVKLLRAEYAEDPEVVVRFLRERSTLTGVSHPHLVAVYDLVAEGETLGIVMDLVDGPDLRQEARESPFSRTEVCAAMSQVAAALDAVHAARIVHRDMKPENVLVERRRPDMFVRLTDFGVARAADGPSLTRMTRVVGTPAYIAPEVVSGRHPGPEGDVYALGVTAYELIARRRPFEEHTTAALLRAHLDTIPTQPAEMDDMLWRVVAACLDKDPGRRPTAAQLGHTFGALAAGQAISPWAPGAGQPGGEGGPQNTQWIWLPPVPAPAQVSPPAAQPALADGPDGRTQLIAHPPAPAQAPRQPVQPPVQPPHLPGQPPHVPPPGHPNQVSSPNQPYGYPPRPVPSSGVQPPVGAWRREGRDPYAPPPPSGPPPAARRPWWRNGWWLVAGATALLAVLGIGVGIWAGIPDPAPTPSKTGAAPGRLVFVPVEAVSTKPGVVRLRFSRGKELAGFQSYAVFQDDNLLQSGIEEEEFIVDPVDMTGTHCFKVAALLATTATAVAEPSAAPPKNCLVADGKGVKAR